jgi:hypothetical protein
MSTRTAISREFWAIRRTIDPAPHVWEENCPAWSLAHTLSLDEEIEKTIVAKKMAGS